MERITEHESAGVLAPPAAAAPRRRGRRAPAVVAALALGAGCVLSLVGFIAWDDSRSHHTAQQQAQRADGLGRELAASRGQAQRLSSDLAAARADNDRLQSDARNPTLAMWNSCGGPCTISASSVRVGSVPDTFQLQINFTADVPVRTYVMTFHQWTQFDGCGFSLRCVSGSYRAYDATTSFSQTIDDAEGCSGYVWVLQAERPGTIRPDVKVRYQPADHPTGVCAQSP
jgi:hypothetical protein